MPSSRIYAARLASVVFVCCVACSDDTSNLRNGVDPDGLLTPGESGPADPGAGGPTPEAGAGDPGEGDGGSLSPSEDAGPPQAVREVDRTLSSTTPKAVIKYVGPSTAPLSILASNLELTNFGSDVSAEWFVRIRNERLLDTLCAFALTFTFKDSTGRELFTLDPTFDMPPHTTNTTSSGVSDCVGPGAEVNGQAIHFGENEGPVELDEVASIEWKFQLAGYFDSSRVANDVTISDLSIGSAALGPSLIGRVSNDTSYTLQVFSIHTWVLNAGGMPLDYFIASYNGDLGAFGDWDFETSGSNVDFDLEDLEIIPSYVR